MPVFVSNPFTSTKSLFSYAGMSILMAINSPVALAQSNPAFNCNKARSSNEITICRNGDLGSLDRQVSQAYSELKSRVNRSARVVIIADQRAWLTTRQKCRSDVSCTRRLYQDRLSYLNRELAPYKNDAPASAQPPAFNPAPPQPPAFNPTPTQPPVFNPAPTQPPAFNPTPTAPPTVPSSNVLPSQNHYFPNGTYKIHILSNTEKLSLNQSGDRILKTGPARGGQLTQNFNLTQTGTANGFVIQSNNGIRLHAHGKGDQQVSTRYQPFDDFTRFKLTPANDGCYFITTVADNKYWIWNPDTTKIQSSFSPVGEESMFCFTSVKSANTQTSPQFTPPPPAYQPPPPAYQPPPPAYQPPRPTYQPTPPPAYQPAPTRGNSPPPFSGSPTRASHFRQPVSGKSLGGIVREGPGINYRRLRSFRNGHRIKILANSGVQMNGYDWFQISLGGNRTAYQWGGIMCSNKFLLKGIYQACRTQRQPTFTPPPRTRAPILQFQPPRFTAPRAPIPRDPRPRRQLSDEERNQSICGPAFTFVGKDRRYRGLADSHGCIDSGQLIRKKTKRRCGRSFTYVGFSSGYRANRNGCYRTNLMPRSHVTGKPLFCAPGFANTGKKGQCENIKKWNAKQAKKRRCGRSFTYVGFNSGYRANSSGCYRTSLMRRSQQSGNAIVCAPGFAHLGKKGKCKNIAKWNEKQIRNAKPKCPKNFFFVRGQGCTHFSKVGE